MKKYLRYFLSIATFTTLFILSGCTKTNYDDFFIYKVQIESPYSQHILIEFFDPKSDIYFFEIITHNPGITFWQYEDLYMKGDYLEIMVETMDKYFTPYIQVEILVFNNIVSYTSGDGTYPLKISYIQNN